MKSPCDILNLGNHLIPYSFPLDYVTKVHQIHARLHKQFQLIHITSID